jgi:hypothetical protein
VALVPFVVCEAITKSTKAFIFEGHTGVIYTLDIAAALKRKTTESMDLEVSWNLSKSYKVFQPLCNLLMAFEIYDGLEASAFLVKTLP